MRYGLREWFVRVGVLVPIPMVPLVLDLTGHTTSAWLLAGIWIGLAVVAVGVAPLGGMRRSEAAALAVTAVGATLVAGMGWLYLVFLTLCPENTTTAVIGIAAGVVLYVISSGVVLRSPLEGGREVALATAIVAGFVLSLVAITVLGGGAQYCST